MRENSKLLLMIVREEVNRWQMLELRVSVRRLRQYPSALLGLNLAHTWNQLRLERCITRAKAQHYGETRMGIDKYTAHGSLDVRIAVS